MVTSSVRQRPPGTARVPITVIICAQDEELNIPDCLSSVAWADQVILVDGGSADSTVRVAALFATEIVAHRWEGYAQQKNWALANLDIRHTWVLFLDADERVPPGLADEISTIVECRTDHLVGYYIARRMVFMGRWLKRSYWYPDYNLRLFRRDRGRFESRLVHETVIVDGSIGYLSHDLIHDDQRDVASYISRLNRYSSLEAQEMYRVLVERSSSEFKPSWKGSWGQRRRALKERVWYRLPLRPIIRLIWTLVLKRGVLDGREGVIFTILACINEWQADVKFYELRRGRAARQPTSLIRASSVGPIGLGASDEPSGGELGRVT